MDDFAEILMFGILAFLVYKVYRLYQQNGQQERADKIPLTPVPLEEQLAYEPYSLFDVTQLDMPIGE